MNFHYNIIFQDGRPAKFSRPFVAASGAVCRLPSCQGAVCLSWMQKSCQGCQWCRLAVFHPVRVPCVLSWMQKSCQGCQWCRVPSSILSGCRVPLMDAKELPGCRPFFYLYIMYKRQKTSENKIFSRKNENFLFFIW